MGWVGGEIYPMRVELTTEAEMTHSESFQSHPHHQLLKLDSHPNCSGSQLGQ